MKWKTTGNISRKGTNEKEYRGKTIEVKTINLIIKQMAKKEILRRDLWVKVAAFEWYFVTKLYIST